MKYCVFKLANQFMPVIFPDHVTHSQVQIEGAELVSAGHFVTSPGPLTVEPHREATSVGLKPRIPEDADLLGSVFDNSGIYAFLADFPMRPPPDGGNRL